MKKHRCTATATSLNQPLEALTTHIRSKAVIALIAIAITACVSTSKGEDINDLGKRATKLQQGSIGDNQPVNISFAAEFIGQPFDCNAQFSGIGLTNAKVTVSEFKVFVSNFRMLDETGKEFPVELVDDGLWQQQKVALLDFENGEGNCSNGTSQTNSQIAGLVTPGQYTGIAFEIGVPFDMNHVDPTLASSPMNLTSMFWNWRGGYRFMRVDLAVADKMKMDTTEQVEPHTKHSPDEAMVKNMEMNVANKHSPETEEGKHGGKHAAHGAGRGWALHVGSTGCEATSPTTPPSSCKNSNRIAVTIDQFNPEVDTLIIDPGAVLSQADVTKNTPETAPGCMSAPTDPECEPAFNLLGLTKSSAGQKLVRVR